MYEGRTFADGRAVAPGGVAQPLTAREATPFDSVGSLWRGRAFVLSFLIFGLAGAVAFLAAATPRYAASASIIVDPSDLRIMDKSLREQNSFSDAQIAQVENDVRVITSTGVLGAVVDGQHLDQDPEFIGGGLSSFGALKVALGVANRATPFDPRLEAIRALTRDVSVRREERTYVVQIVVTTREAAKSMRLADAVVAAFLSFSGDEHTESSRRVTASLQERLSDLRRSLEVADQNLVDYRQQHGIVAAVGQSVAEAQLAEASTALGQSRKRLEDLRSRYNQVLQARRSGNGGAFPEALQSLTIGNLRAQLAQVARHRDDLLATLGPRHPEVVRVLSEERGLRALLKDETDRIAAVAGSDLARATEDEAAAQITFDTLKSSVGTNSQLAVRLRELEREVDATRTVYEAFLVRTRELTEQAQINPSDNHVISGGQVLEGQTWPPRPLLVLAGGAVAGLMAGVSMALGLGLFGARSAWPARLGVAPVRYVA